VSATSRTYRICRILIFIEVLALVYIPSNPLATVSRGRPLGV
jgi:hypothetical protein